MSDTLHTQHDDEHQWIAVGSIVEHTNDEVADICSCNPQDFGQEAIAPTYQEQCANAKLIAQAPYLLDLVKNMIEILKEEDIVKLAIKHEIESECVKCQLLDCAYSVVEHIEARHD